MAFIFYIDKLHEKSFVVLFKNSICGVQYKLFLHQYKQKQQQKN